MRGDGATGRYDALGLSASPDLQRLVRLAAATCEVRNAAIHLGGPADERRVAGVGTQRPPVAAEPGGTGYPRVDGAGRPGGDRSGGAQRAGCYASTPLLTDAGVPVGRICLWDDVPRDLTGAQRASLETVAEQVVSVLELRLQLAEIRGEPRRCHDQLTLFASQVGHDLRTPLTAVLANAEMLAAEPAVVDADHLGWMVNGITRAANRMNTMIEEMLGYAREGGAPSPQSTPLAEVFAAALADLHPLVAQTDAEVVLGDLPVLPADPRQMCTVARHLLSNALKFARPGTPPRVEVGAERCGDLWRVKVADNGTGVPAARREAMFVLFARGDKRVEGDGIGLAAARRVVEAHGGRIGLEDAEGGGTTAWFELPA